MKLLIAVVLLGVIMAEAAVVSRRFLDAVDMCILACDYCFKADGLLECANHCIGTDGVVAVPWRLRCPALNALEDVPSVQQV